MFDLIIRSGQVVTPWGVGNWDIGSRGSGRRRRPSPLA